MSAINRAPALRAVADGALKVGSLAARAASHAVWYVQYQVQGTPRDAPRRRRGRR